MRAGNLDRVITIQAFSSTVDDDGTPIEGWTDVATMRAQIVKSSTDEFLAGYGENYKTIIVFRTWWINNITTSHRVKYQGLDFKIVELKEIGRRRGLEIRCDTVRA